MDERPTRDDVVNCYWLALGREPESDAVVQEKLGQPRSGLLADFFSSGEFEMNVRAAVAAGGPLRAPLFQGPLPEALRRWIADFAALTPQGRDAVLEAASWPRLFHGLFCDPQFAEAVLNPATRLQNPAFLAALEARGRLEDMGRIEGRVELVTPAEVRGWALDTRNPDRRLAVELRAQGGFVAAGATDLFRPDIQARFGGDGRAGFAIRRPLTGGGGGGRVELCEAASGAVLDSFDLPDRPAPPLDAAQAVRRELAELRNLLDRIEARLPDFNEAFTYDLASYAEYWEAAYGFAACGEVGPPLDLLAVLDASEAAPARLDQALASVARQGRPPRWTAVIHPGGDLKLEYEACISRWRAAWAADTRLFGVTVEDRGWVAAMEAARAGAPAAHLLVLDADARLAADAAARFADALGEGAGVVYADSDTAPTPVDDLPARHRDPRLRSGFDLDLLLQHQDLGPALGLSGPLLETFGLDARYGREALFDLLLRGVEAQGAATVSHIPRVLSHAAPGWTDADAGARAGGRADVVRAHLARTAPGAALVPHADELGARLPHASRVRRPAPEGVRVAIIIPTRDRLDLLGPCIASLAAAASSNRMQAEILVVDNQSTPATREALDGYARLAPLRVIEHDGRFNWAVINNRAAEATDAEVLIFLNNDTVVLTPDWCDELCSQALRPEVGAVGARLLYEDGSIQHAGMVMGGWRAFSAHEGMGAPGSDPGYLGRHALARQVSCVTGACLATRAEVFRALGGFDALNLPVEANDTDYCLRVRAQGLAVLYDPYCTLYHFESKSRGHNLTPQARSAAEAAGALMRERWGATYRDDPFYNPHFDRLSAPFTRLGTPRSSGARPTSAAERSSGGRAL